MDVQVQQTLPFKDKAKNTQTKNTGKEHYHCGELEKPTKEVRIQLIHIVNNIVTLGTSVAVLQALADAPKTAGERKVFSVVNTVSLCTNAHE